MDLGSMDESYQLLAAQHVRKHANRLVAQLDGVRHGADIEFLHQARVASRRLRAALRTFRGCFPRNKVKAWRKAIRRLTRGLGPARDRDVQIEFLRGVLSNLKEKAHRAGVARLLLRLEQSRRAMQPGVLKAVERFGETGVTDEMLAATKKIRAKRKKRSVPRRSPYVARQAEEHVCVRLNALMEYEESLGDPGDHQQHHAMRIAAKRLRYTMEIYQPVYEGRLDGFVKEVKNLQTLLGDVHDCDVWGEHLETFMEEERQRTITYFGHARPFGQLKVGLDHFRQDRRRRREERFCQLAQCWQELNHDGLWEGLIQTLRSVEQPAVRAERTDGAHATGAARKQGVPRPSDDHKRRIDEPEGQTSPTKDRHLGPSVPDDRPGRQYARVPGDGRTERSEP